MTIRTDVLIVGAGAAGLFAALHLPVDLEVVVVDKGRKGRGSSSWAQGGVAAALAPEDAVELHVADTVRVAAGHADAAAVEVLCSEAPECVLELVELGTAFDRDSDGSLHLAREGGQSAARSAHRGDATGAAIMKTLRDRATDRVTRLEGTCVRLDVVEGRCVGGWVVTDEGLVQVQASSTILATGGVGGLFSTTTNPPGATGDGIVLAWEAGAGLADLEFIQFHPTALAAASGVQTLLLTEALRGAGAYVVDADGRRFLFDHHSDGELAPRDVVARAIASHRAFLDCRHLGDERLASEFPTVVAGCRQRGLDPGNDLLPIAPAAHYSIGGITTDLDGRSSIPRLYAVGECASTGAHGANRLAGNSLAEALVFGRRAARAISTQRSPAIKDTIPAPRMDEDAPVQESEWDALRHLCTKGLGLERDPAGLGAVAGELEQVARSRPSRDRSRLELRSAAVAARLIARSALLRTESRGVHARRDHGEPDPAWAGVRLRLARN